MIGQIYFFVERLSSAVLTEYRPFSTFLPAKTAITPESNGQELARSSTLPSTSVAFQSYWRMSFPLSGYAFHDCNYRGGAVDITCLLYPCSDAVTGESLLLRVNLPVCIVGRTRRSGLGHVDS